MDANEDGQGQERYEAESWILCKGRVGRVTFRAGPTWGSAGACVVRHRLPHQGAAGRGSERLDEEEEGARPG